MMNDMNKIGYYAIIPATVLFNENMKSNEKLLYAVITALSNKEGYCFASNKYLANLLNAKDHTISKWISHLKELDFVCLEFIKNEKNEIIQRRIYPNDTPYRNRLPYAINETYPYAINGTEGMLQKGQYNNISNNNINKEMIDRLFNYIMNEENNNPPKEFKNVSKLKIIELLYKYEMFYTKDMINNMQENNIQKIKEMTYVIALLVKDNLQQFTSHITRDKLIQLYNECKTREQDYKGTENEIEGFVNYYYKSVKNEMMKVNKPSFFSSTNKDNNRKIIEKNEEDEEL